MVKNDYIGNLVIEFKKNKQINYLNVIRTAVKDHYDFIKNELRDWDKVVTEQEFMDIFDQGLISSIICFTEDKNIPFVDFARFQIKCYIINQLNVIQDSSKDYAYKK